MVLVAGWPIAQADSGYDQPQPTNVRDILPPSLVDNEYFTIRDEVTWFDGLHMFTVDTEFGSFEIWGEPMLRVRLREFVAWHELREVSSTEAGAQAVGRTVMRPARALVQAFSHPVETVKGVPQGIGRMFRRIGRKADNVSDAVTGEEDDETIGDVNRDAVEGERTKAGKAADSLVGVNSAFRRWAAKVEVNPYTTNEALIAELNRLAKADAYVSAPAKILIPGIPGALGLVSKVTRNIYRLPWYEVVEENRKSLVGMGIGEDRIEALFDNANVNLIIQTLVIEMLKELEGVEGRSNAVEQMILLKSESEAIWFAETMLMADWFHENETPLQALLPGTLVPVVHTTDGRVIAFTASDYVYWTSFYSSLLSSFLKQFESRSDQREIWIADQVSPRFVDGVGALGWGVKSGIRGTILPEIPWGLQDDGT
jgi:hypothetical protein